MCFLKLNRWFGLASLNPSMSVDKLWDFTWSAWNMYACIKYIYIYIGFYNVAMKCVKQKSGAAELQILVSRHEQTPISASLAFAAFYLVSFHLHRFTCSMFYLPLILHVHPFTCFIHSFTQSSHPITSLEAFHLFHLFHLTNNSHNNIGKSLTYVN